MFVFFTLICIAGDGNGDGVFVYVWFCLLKIKQTYTQHLLIFKIMGTNATLQCNFSRSPAAKITTVFKSYVHLMVLKVQLKGIYNKHVIFYGATAATASTAQPNNARTREQFYESESNEIVFRWHHYNNTHIRCCSCCRLLQFLPNYIQLLK